MKIRELADTLAKIAEVDPDAEVVIPHSGSLWEVLEVSPAILYGEKTNSLQYRVKANGNLNLLVISLKLEIWHCIEHFGGEQLITVREGASTANPAASLALTMAKMRNYIEELENARRKSKHPESTNP